MGLDFEFEKNERAKMGYCRINWEYKKFEKIELILVSLFVFVIFGVCQKFKVEIVYGNAEPIRIGANYSNVNFSVIFFFLLHSYKYLRYLY